jgi:transposase
MSSKLSPEEVAVMIRARQISKDKGLDPNSDVKTICQKAGISRKTGYQWAKKYSSPQEAKKAELGEELNQLKVRHEALIKSYDDLRFENEGRKLAWEIHGVDEFLASKKNIMPSKKSKKP